MEEEEGEEEHISDSSSSVSSCLTSELSSSWVGSDTNSSSLAETDSFSLFAESGEGLVGEVRGLDAEVRTGEEMTKERLLLLLLLLDSPFTTKTLLECCFSSLLITS